MESSFLEGQRDIPFVAIIDCSFSALKMKRAILPSCNIDLGSICKFQRAKLHLSSLFLQNITASYDVKIHKVDSCSSQCSFTRCESYTPTRFYCSFDKCNNFSRLA